MTYAQRLLDPRWQRKRLEVLNRDQFTCIHCGDTKATLHVHHEAYDGKNPWDTPDFLLSTLCHECHEIEHLKLTELERLLLNAVRNRDRGNFEQIKMLNRVVKNYKKAEAP
jgi:5-methylcytosine-specific restriction endonuclease McrA